MKKPTIRKKAGKKQKRKKAFLFTMDAFLASALLIGTLILFANINVHKSNTENLELMSRDVLETISKIKINDIKDTNQFVHSQIENGNITNLNNSVLQQIGEFWAKNQDPKARELASTVLQGVIPKGYGFNFTLEDDVIYNISKSEFTGEISSRRMISGIEKGKPISGSTSDAFLKSVRDKPSSVYLYFGGFVGQGNITGTLFVPPVQNITGIEMELHAGNDFSLFINGDQCSEQPSDFTFNPSSTGPENMTSSHWDISHCNASIKKSGEFNNFTLVFGDINGAYVAGGYIKISYKTDEFRELDYGTNTTRIYLPGIFGIVNLFDSFYIPGELNNLTIHMHYIADHTNSNYTFYATIGDQTVYVDNESTTEMFVTLNDSNFTSLNYADFNSTTVPIRIGFENVSFQTIITGGEGFGDIILTTDVSGSMDGRFAGFGGSTQRDCSSAQLYDDSTQKLSVAKCVDKVFTDMVLQNTTLNRIGLASYSTNTRSVFPLTNDEESLKTEIDSYTQDGATCVSCGIASSFNTLLNTPLAQLHKKTWKFTTDYQFVSPPANWNQFFFDDSSWNEGAAPFGYRQNETTTIGSFVDVDMWEYPGDVSGEGADFSSGTLNTTGNTFGLAGNNDGWDWSSTVSGVYGGDNSGVSFNGIVNHDGNNMLNIYISGNSGDRTSSGAYGLKVNITQEIYNLIQSTGYFVFSFNYEWIPTYPNWYVFEADDEVWIKARITNTTGTTSYLSGTYDDGGVDATPEIDGRNNPDLLIGGFFSQDITSYITEPGMYYIDFGGKLFRDGFIESGDFYFDNIRLSATNLTGNTYYRNEFMLTDLSRFSDARLYVASDNRTEIYLNGNLIDDDLTDHPAQYWNRNVSIPISAFNDGANLLAVKLYNNDSESGFFDLSLVANMTGRQKALVIMSDGEANTCIKDWTTNDQTFQGEYCGECSGRPCCPNPSTGAFDTRCPDIAGIGVAGEQVVNLSCYLKDNYNISIYTVAFGDDTTGRTILNLTASLCDNASHYYLGDNVSGLADIYQDIADSILTGFSSRQSQIIVTTGGNYEKSTLYPDSYIEFEYDPIVEEPEANELSLTFESQKFSSCTPQVDIPSGIRIIDSRITSFSGHRWTDFVGINSHEVFNLSKYNNQSYISLGDPFVIQIPPNLLIPGEINNISIKTGDEPTFNTNCSENNSLQYVGLINASTGRTPVLSGTEGCNWTIESEDGSIIHLKIPQNYEGTKQCNYTNVSIGGFDTQSTYDDAVIQLLRSLDFDNDGRTLINIEEENLEINVILVTGLPYQWGPSIAQARFWR